MPDPTPLEWLHDIAANGYVMAVHLRDGGVGDLFPEDITAGLAEAVAAERERIADAVEALPRAWTDDPDHLVTRAAVLAIVRGEQP